MAKTDQSTTIRQISIELERLSTRLHAISPIAKTLSNETLADQKWGYRFGVDGVMSFPSACKFLDLKRTAMFKLIKAGRVRKGKDVGGEKQSRVRLCRRSITDYAHSLEE